MPSNLIVARALCIAGFCALSALNAGLLIAGLLGMRRILGVGLTSSSGGGAARELREGLRLAPISDTVVSRREVYKVIKRTGFFALAAHIQMTTSNNRSFRPYERSEKSGSTRSVEYFRDSTLLALLPAGLALQPPTACCRCSRIQG